MQKMPTSALKQLLTETRTSDGQPLFKNALKLAEAIAELAPSEHETLLAKLRGSEVLVNPYAGRARTAAPYLYQVLSGARPCSERMQHLIEAAIRARLEDTEEARRFIQAFTDILRKSVLDARNITSHELPTSLEELLESEESAPTVLVMEPIELSLIDYVADPLRRRMIHRFQLEEGGRRPRAGHVRERHGLKQIRRASRFTFCFPNRQAALNEWRRLYTRLRKGLSVQDKTIAKAHPDPAKPLSKLCEGSQLSMQVLPRELCQIPLVALNPGRREEARVYISGSSRALRDMVALDPELIAKWQRDIYVPLIRDGNLDSIVGWSEVASSIEEL